MNRVTHFEIHATDPAVLISFYTALFGWKIEQWGEMPYWMVVTGSKEEPGINGGIVPRPHASTGDRINSSVNTIEVTDLDAMMTKALELGGSVALPKMPIPGMGWLAYMKDPDQNIFGLMQNDPTAK